MNAKATTLKLAISRFPILLIAPLSIIFSGCATTGPGSSAGMTYSHPRTDGLITVGVSLKDCGTTLATSKFDIEVKMISKAGTDASRNYYIAGSDLANYRIKRNLTIGVDGNGVIKSINSTNSDRTAVIVSNVIKTVAAVAPLLAVVSTTVCNPQVEKAVDEAKTLEFEIAELKKAINASPTPPVGQIVNHIELINKLATELAALRTGILRVDTKGVFTIDKADVVPPDPSGNCTATKTVSLDAEPILKWFVPTAVTAANIASHFEIKGCVTSNATPTKVEPLVSKTSKRDRDCELQIKLPEPTSIKAQLKLTGAVFPNRVGPKWTMHAAQVKEPGTLCLDVGFGESRTVAMKFDSFGRKTEFTWSSEASGEAMSGAIAGYAAGLTGIAGSLAGTSELASQKEEIDRLKTQKTLNELRQCQAIIEAGGYKCTPD